MRADFIRLLCGAVALLSMVFFLYGMTKIARLEESPPAIQLDSPGIEVVKVTTPDTKSARDQATLMLVGSGLTFLASLAAFGLATWKRRPQQAG
jgi:hypothetical protein